MQNLQLVASNLQLPLLKNLEPGAGLAAGCLLARLPEQLVALLCTTLWSGACQLCLGTVDRRFIQVLNQTPTG